MNEMKETSGEKVVTAIFPFFFPAHFLPFPTVFQHLGTCSPSLALSTPCSRVDFEKRCGPTTYLAIHHKKGGLKPQGTCLSVTLCKGLRLDEIQD